MGKKCTPKEEYRRLRKIVQRWKSRGVVGADKLLEQCDEMTGLEQRVAFLAAQVPKQAVGRPKRLQAKRFRPSEGKSVAGRVSEVQLVVTCVKKGLRTKCVATLRTLAFYAHLRQKNCEDHAPVPKLYTVDKDGLFSNLILQHMGPDASLKQRVSNEEFKALRDLSIKELAEIGFDESSVTHQKRNWAVTPLPGHLYGHRAVLLDVGGLYLKGKKGKK